MLKVLFQEDSLGSRVINSYSFHANIDSYSFHQNHVSGRCIIILCKRSQWIFFASPS